MSTRSRTPSLCMASPRWLPMWLPLCVCGPALAAPEDELQRIEEQRRQAIKAKDFDTLSAIYAPDFQGITGAGQPILREALFRVFDRTDPSLTFNVDEVRVAVHGDTAVYVGRLVAVDAAGKALSASRFSHVFVRRGGAWVCVAGQSTPIAAN